jgi:septum formation inhibitor-activating ATPase MinD
MESENSDNEFKLNQKRRELQHYEDQLHMLSKDLKQKEFDITSADSPADISSSQLAELAQR